MVTETSLERRVLINLACRLRKSRALHRRLKETGAPLEDVFRAEGSALEAWHALQSSKAVWSEAEAEGCLSGASTLLSLQRLANRMEREWLLLKEEVDHLREDRARLLRCLEDYRGEAVR